MKKMKIIKQKTIYNTDLIETFLEEQHKEGWKLVKVSPMGVYHFEECESEEMVYCLDEDKHSIMDDKDSYIQDMKEQGWHFILIHRNSNFFRKSKKNMKDGENFPVDRRIDVENLEKLNKNHILSSIIVGSVLVPQLWRFFKDGSYGLVVLLVFAMIIDIVAIVNLSRNCIRLREKYRKK